MYFMSCVTVKMEFMMETAPTSTVNVSSPTPRD